MRCGDAEREPVIDQLKQAFAEGRLDQDELDLRVHLAMTAKTRGDLAAVMVDLAPVPSRSSALRPMGDPYHPTDGDRVLAAVAHGIGYFTSFVGPLVVSLTAGKKSAYVRRHAIEALNFQITVLLVTILTFGLGGLLWLVIWIPVGIAALSALANGRFRYPLTLRLIK
jgi:uncharacterized Tic20 family protein